MNDERDIQQLRQSTANVRSAMAQHARRFRDVGIIAEPYHGPTRGPVRVSTHITVIFSVHQHIFTCDYIYLWLNFRDQKKFYRHS